MSCGNECHFTAFRNGSSYALEKRGNYDPRGMIATIGYQEHASPMVRYLATPSRQMPELGSFKEYNKTGYVMDLPIKREAKIVTKDENYSNLISALNQAEDLVGYHKKIKTETESKKIRLEEMIKTARNKWTN